MSESRPNFILLLGLEMSSPITDDAVEEAISRFKTQLTLDEKNPRRAADAAERRRLLTELQRVMRDPSLREREIAAAHTALKSVADDAFAEAQAYASKGFLTPKEFEALADRYASRGISRQALEKLCSRIRDPGAAGCSCQGGIHFPRPAGSAGAMAGGTEFPLL